MIICVVTSPRLCDHAVSSEPVERHQTGVGAGVVVGVQRPHDAPHGGRPHQAPPEGSAG